MPRPIRDRLFVAQKTGGRATKKTAGDDQGGDMFVGWSTPLSGDLWCDQRIAQHMGRNSAWTKQSAHMIGHHAAEISSVVPISPCSTQPRSCPPCRSPQCFSESCLRFLASWPRTRLSATWDTRRPCSFYDKTAVCVEKAADKGATTKPEISGVKRERFQIRQMTKSVWSCLTWSRNGALSRKGCSHQVDQ